MTDPSPGTTDRRALHEALLLAEPWLGHDELGPRAVDAGPCDRCGDRPRVLPTCGPDGFPGLCRRCALDLGTDAWCDGHLDEARAALTWAEALPSHWDLAVTLYWVATGEVRLGSLVDLRRDPRLPASLREALGTG